MLSFVKRLFPLPVMWPAVVTCGYFRPVLTSQSSEIGFKPTGIGGGGCSAGQIGPPVPAIAAAAAVRQSCRVCPPPSPAPRQIGQTISTGAAVSRSVILCPTHWPPPSLSPLLLLDPFQRQLALAQNYALPNLMMVVDDLMATSGWWRVCWSRLSEICCVIHVCHD